MLGMLLPVVALAIALPSVTSAEAKTAKPNRIDIRYEPPKSAEHQPVYQLLKDNRALEKLRELLSPIRLPRRLLLKTEGCDGSSNAWYDGTSVTVCYEYLDDVWKNVPDDHSHGVAPIDALIGPMLDVFLHEVGHAVFDILKIPLFGREEDAADQFSAFIMLKFEKSEARRLILGNAYQYKADLEWPTVSIAVQKFADEHGTAAQRFYNLLCLAYGADKELFGDFVSKGYLPKSRAEGCEDEYRQVAHAFNKLIQPWIHPGLAQKNHKRWLRPIDTPPPRRPARGN